MSAPTLDNPIIIQRLFSDPQLAWLWLPLRLYLGWTWFSAGWERLNDVDWIVSGKAVRQFWADAVVFSVEGDSPIAFDWYRAFIKMLLDGGHHTWFARLLVFTEITVGILLILGAFTGLAAAIAAFMNWNFIMAGAGSANSLLFVWALFLLIAWRVAGYYGLDFKLLSALSTLGRRSVEPD